jgi:NADH-quinone oxidoreductase subunit A
MADYLLLLLMLALVGLFGSISLVASRLLAPNKPTRAKLEPYECGIVPEHEPPERFPVQFYLVAMVFLLFDIEIVFMYPWAARLTDLGAFGFWEMLTFVSFLLLAFGYLWREGIFDWGPSRRRIPGALGPQSPESAAVRPTGEDAEGDDRRAA